MTRHTPEQIIRKPRAAERPSFSERERTRRRWVKIRRKKGDGSIEREIGWRELV
jgi:hypothetical protein